DGSFAGGGRFVKGTPVGEHLLRYPNGAIKMLALYDGMGKLSEPISEYYPGGQIKSLYTSVGEGYEGEFKQWYENGQLMTEYVYLEGSLDGEQKEYYADGKLKLKAHFRQKMWDGPSEEWY